MDQNMHLGDRVELLIPCFNPNDDLLLVIRAIDIACEKYGLHFRINIFDDCSSRSDSYKTLFTRFAAIRIHKNEKNIGECQNVNQAVRLLAAEGARWFILLHADDIARPEWLLRCARYVEKYDALQPGLMHCATEGVQRLPDVGEDQEKDYDWGAEEIDIPGDRVGIDFVSHNWCWIPSGTLIRTDGYLAMGGFHPHLRSAGDNDFLVRWLLAGMSVRHVRAIGVYKHLHQDSATGRAMRQGWDNEGWCYLMVRYAAQRTLYENLYDHLRWLYGNGRALLRALKPRQLELETAKSRLYGMTLVPRSFLTILMPSFRFLLPARIKFLLESVPAGPTAQAITSNSVQEV